MLVSKTFSPKRISRNGEQRNVVGMCWRGHYSSYSLTLLNFSWFGLYPISPPFALLLQISFSYLCSSENARSHIIPILFDAQRPAMQRQSACGKA